ncbi:hypothetical protein ACE102_33480 [Bradyrhizobium sp. vgs-9]|uniref:hypothetical protein n=1 Tax=Bradyrhizobium sp. vgs-9 TaxID=208389 RepID=UPI0035D527C3
MSITASALDRAIILSEDFSRRMSPIRRLSAQQCKAIFAHLVNLADARSRLRLPHHDRPFCLQMTKLFLRYIKADMSGYFFNLRQRADEPSKFGGRRRKDL